MTVLIVEDHPAIAEGLAGLLSDEDDMTVRVAVDVRAAEAVLATESPDVALCDVMLDGSEAGFELLSRFGGVGGTAFVMYSAFGFPRFHAMAVERGAAGYVLKTASVEHIVAAIRRAATGARLTGETTERARGATALPTGREMQLLGLVADGHTNREIAARLGVSIKTVESGLRRLFDRYDVSNRTALAGLARREGWLIG